MLETYLQNIKPLDQTAMQQAQAQWNRIAKPLHSLGRLEDMVIQLAGITGSAALVPRKKAVLISALTTASLRKTSHNPTTMLPPLSQKISPGESPLSMRCPVSAVRMSIQWISALPEICTVPVWMSEKWHTVPAICQRAGNDTRRSSTGNLHRNPAGEGKERGRIQSHCNRRNGNRQHNDLQRCASVLTQTPPEQLTGRGAGLSSSGLAHKQKSFKTLSHPANRTDTTFLMYCPRSADWTSAVLPAHF